MDVAEKGFDCSGVGEEKLNRLSFTFEFAPEDVSFMLVVWAHEEVVTDCFGDNSLAVRA